MDGFGWEPEPEGELFELTMRRAELARVLRTLNGTARSKLHDQVTKPLEEADIAQRALLSKRCPAIYSPQLADQAQQ